MLTQPAPEWNIKTAMVESGGASFPQCIPANVSQ